MLAKAAVFLSENTCRAEPDLAGRSRSAIDAIPEAAQHGLTRASPDAISPFHPRLQHDRAALSDQPCAPAQEPRSSRVCTAALPSYLPTTAVFQVNLQRRKGKMLVPERFSSHNDHCKGTRHGVARFGLWSPGTAPLTTQSKTSGPAKSKHEIQPVRRVLTYTE